MRVAVTGATGNVGVRVVERLLADPAVTSVVGVARRPPSEDRDVSWVSCDLSKASAVGELSTALSGADVVIHLAWLIQPSHQPDLMRATNVTGSAHLLRAITAASVPALVHASSLGAYSPGPDKTTRVDESWPTEGIPGSLYSAHKAEVERMLDTFEREHSGVRVARVRPAVVLQREAAAEQARYFLGRLVPPRLIHRSLIPAVPLPKNLVIQAVHAQDIADLFVRAAVSPSARGGYNGADEPLLTPAAIAEVLGAKLLPLPEAALRLVVDATWRLRVQPTDRGWVELGLRSPLLSTERARSELGWEPRHSALDTLAEALDGIGAKSGGPTPVLRRSA